MQFAAILKFERPTLTDDAAQRNVGRAGWLIARRSTPARSANHTLALLSVQQTFRFSKQIRLQINISRLGRSESLFSGENELGFRHSVEVFSQQRNLLD